MKRTFLSLLGSVIFTGLLAQTVSQRLQKAFGQFESDSQLRHAISSLYVIDANTGEVVFDKNSQVGLAGASTQKIVTATTAFELLGKDYRYKTEVGYSSGGLNNNRISHGKLFSNLIIEGHGDPTLGSSRFDSQNDDQFLKKIVYSLKQLGIDTIVSGVSIAVSGFECNSIPDGWIWQDIGNYYGAGYSSFNWRENQYDVALSSPDELDAKVNIMNAPPAINLTSYVTSAKKGTGDNGYIYLPLNDKPGVITGTIPLDENSFKLSGAIPDVPAFFLEQLKPYLLSNKIFIKGESNTVYNFNPPSHSLEAKESLIGTVLFTNYSPPLDSIIYWFLKKSINLYGEALVKTFAYEKQGFGSTDSGVNIVKKFWKEKGLDPEELNIYDGSGLSPLNRLTTHAQVEVLKFAKSRPWFSSFYYALPEYNGMKMKSGTISDVKGFCGYQKSKDGKEYIFSFLVNNYNGKTSGVVNKMYKVLDELK